jgi:hypothetical protein
MKNNIKIVIYKIKLIIVIIFINQTISLNQNDLEAFIYPEVTFGYTRTNIDELNKMLIENDLPEMFISQYFFGLGLKSGVEKVHFHFSYATSLQEKYIDAYKSSSRINSFDFNIGYFVLDKEYFRLYPYVGINGQRSHFQISEHYFGPTSLTLNDYMKEDFFNIRYSSSRGFLNLGTGFTIMRIFGFKSGFFVPISNTRWRVDEFDLNLSKTSPSLKQSFYFAFSFEIDFRFFSDE